MATVRFIPYHDSIHHCLHKVLGQFGHAPATRLIHGQYTPPAKGRAAHERAPSLLASLHRHYSSALSPSVRVDTTGRQKRNSAPWTSEDDQALLRLREQGCTWGEVGRAMRKSRQACSHRFNTVLDPVLGDSFWRQDPHRSEILAALVHQKFSWKEIAQQLNTNASSCEHQWRVLQRRDVATENTTIAVNSGGTRSKLSRQDLERLQSAVQLHGTDQWETIAKETFDMAFTATYLRHQYIAQERKRQVWTMSQEEQLLLAVQKILDGDLEDISSCDRLICDQQWQRIAEQIQGKHTALECKNKWLKLKFLKAKREAKMSQSVSLGLQQDDLNLRITWTPEQTAALRALVEDMKTLAVEKQSEESFKIDWGMVADKMGRRDRGSRKS
ncbi:hypothetical protein BGZ94_009118 [Podila epigama]|nr:hypothetical protein BGZ94_009118 [Podila epigama]